MDHLSLANSQLYGVLDTGSDRNQRQSHKIYPPLDAGESTDKTPFYLPIFKQQEGTTKYTNRLKLHDVIIITKRSSRQKVKVTLTLLLITLIEKNLMRVGHYEEEITEKSDRPEGKSMNPK